jgi:galactoside O-acetyltransferase
MNSFYTTTELESLGLKKYGTNVLISKKTSIYGASNISIGDNVRIDDFCILSGNISIGNYVHIAAYCALFGSEAGIILEDFSGLSSRITIYAASDDYSGEFLTNPTVGDKYKNVINKQVKVGRHVIVGTNSTILPGVSVNEGASIGACSLVTNDCIEWGIYFGIPAKRIKERSRKLLELEKNFLNNL